LAAKTAAAHVMPMFKERWRDDDATCSLQDRELYWPCTAMLQQLTTPVIDQTISPV